MKKRGFDIGLKWLARTGTQIIGICGGYQMLGIFIRDPLRLESATTVMDGVGLLPAYTVFSHGKSVALSKGILARDLPGTPCRYGGGANRYRKTNDGDFYSWRMTNVVVDENNYGDRAAG